MMAHLESLIGSGSFVGQDFSAGGKIFKVKMADNFEYTDPVDKSVAKNQVCAKCYYESAAYLKAALFFCIV